MRSAPLPSWWVTAARRPLLALAFGAVSSASGAVTSASAQQVPTSPMSRTPLPPAAFVHVAVIPMDREQVLTDQTVVVQGGRITALGPARRVRVPRGATRVDGRGRYLIPGLADMHAHIMWLSEWDPAIAAESLSEVRSRLLRFVAEGVTTVRELSVGNPPLLALKAQAASGAIVSPRLYVAVRPWGLKQLSPRLDSAVLLAKQAGYDLIKFWSAPEGAELDSILATAQRVRLPIAGHAPDSDNRRAIAEHYTSVEHLLGFWHPQDKNVADEADLRATAGALRHAGVRVCPTLNHILHGGLVAASDTTTLYHAITVLRDSGVALLAGTDVMGPPAKHYLVADELARLVKAGLTPYEALATATRNVAEYLGTLDSTGTVAVGKRADLVLLNGNPLEDIRHSSDIAGVMVGGRWLAQAEIAQRLAANYKDVPDGR